MDVNYSESTATRGGGVPASKVVNGGWVDTTKYAVRLTLFGRNATHL